MQYVILGMLLGGPLSAYELRGRFERVVSLFYSASLGSIQRALSVLAENGHVVVEEVAASPRGKKIHRVTPSGRRAWEEWMREPVSGSDLEQDMLARVFFLGRLADADARAAVIDGIRARIDDDFARLREIAEAAPETDDPVAAYQLATLDFGLRSLELARSWARGLAAVAA